MWKLATGADVEAPRSSGFMVATALGLRGVWGLPKPLGASYTPQVRLMSFRHSLHAFSTAAFATKEQDRQPFLGGCRLPSAMLSLCFMAI